MGRRPRRAEHAPPPAAVVSSRRRSVLTPNPQPAPSSFPSPSPPPPVSPSSLPPSPSSSPWASPNTSSFVRRLAHSPTCVRRVLARARPAVCADGALSLLPSCLRGFSSPHSSRTSWAERSSGLSLLPSPSRILTHPTPSLLLSTFATSISPRFLRPDGEHALPSPVPPARSRRLPFPAPTHPSSLSSLPLRLLQNEFRALAQYFIWHDPKRDITAKQEHATSGWDRESMRDCWTFLDLTSRSFAAVIKELDGDLARCVSALSVGRWLGGRPRPTAPSRPQMRGTR